MDREHPQDECELDFDTLAESCELECKLAHGADGKGQLPKDFWPTYSAMANTRGGVVLLGVREHKGQFTVAGIDSLEKVKQDLFNQLDNPSKVNINLLSDDDVITLTQNGKQYLRINIPAALRKEKPVFINNDMFLGTYRRLHDGDRRCDRDTVKRMLTEQLEDERDARILKGFTFDDLDPESISAYRNQLSAAKPGHTWLDLPAIELVKMLRGWRRDRATGEEGITLAGLLMFGKWEAIQEGAPRYLIDYQERPEAKAEKRWIDRVFPDGSWSGNLFDFYRKVYRKLIADLKVQFTLSEGQRVEDSPVHVALREALVNALVHADYSGSVSVMIVKRPDMFGFRNPGLMRIPYELAIKGSNSDCRNGILHQMFLMIGLGERAGSGIPKIFSGWKSNRWTQPRLREIESPEQTILELHMADIIPQGKMVELSNRLAIDISTLSALEVLILYYADIEEWIDHKRICEVTEDHPRSVTVALYRLERQGLLASQGRHKQKVYHLPDVQLLTPDDEDGQVFIQHAFIHDPMNQHVSLGSQELGQELGQELSQELSQWLSPEVSPEVSIWSRMGVSKAGMAELNLPEILDNSMYDKAIWAHLESTASIYKAIPKRKVSPKDTREAIIRICDYGFLQLTDISKLLGRKPDPLRRDYLMPMVKEGYLVLAFPHTRSNPKQGYRTALVLPRDESSDLGE